MSDTFSSPHRSYISKNHRFNPPRLPDACGWRALLRLTFVFALGMEPIVQLKARSFTMFDTNFLGAKPDFFVAPTFSSETSPVFARVEAGGVSAIPILFASMTHFRSQNGLPVSHHSVEVVQMKSYRPAPITRLFG